jgi:oxygen-independent coproporphyrinogen III oxidase
MKHLYVHAPFCARRCSYCDFAIHVARRPPVAAWLDAIEAEARLTAAALGWSGPERLETLYVGGGTPSLLGVGAMGALAERLAPWFDLGGLVEWTAEANPESIDEALARDWHEAGIRRVSLGVQTFHAPALRWMGRLHGPEGGRRALDAVRLGGIDDVSIDLIFALPERLGRDWAADLAATVELEPTHVSLYGLTAESGAHLGRRVAEGRETMMDEESYATEYRLAASTLGAAGFEHYEVSNFARTGRRSRHNSAYWTGADYLGLGSGAHSFVRGERWWNERDWNAWSRTLAEGTLAIADRERLTDAQSRLERIWLGLRHDGGYDGAIGPAQAALLDRWHEGGLLAGRGPVRLTEAGWLLLDQLAVDLDATYDRRPDAPVTGDRSQATGPASTEGPSRSSKLEARS